METKKNIFRSILRRGSRPWEARSNGARLSNTSARSRRRTRNRYHGRSGGCKCMTREFQRGAAGVSSTAPMVPQCSKKSPRRQVIHAAKTCTRSFRSTKERIGARWKITREKKSQTPYERVTARRGVGDEIKAKLRPNTNG